ncbi:MAG: transglycosylase SLT domain-containing protein, partial [Candidatus Melainabacteria bacterium]|nr:transglycosylase SLT domain-containing protein [Candidatus Melainabacteria bacterium]
MGHHKHYDRQDFDNQNFDRPHHGGEHRQGGGWHVELGNMGFHQIRIEHGRYHPSLPYMEIPGNYEAPQNRARPHYGSTETNYYQHSNRDQYQGQLEFSNPYNQQPQHEHHRHHHGRHHNHQQYQSGEYQSNSGRNQGDRSNQGHRSIYTYDGAIRSNPEQAMESARVVAQVARRLGVDPVVAVAAMLVESGGNPRAVGDNGHSFGLFQLNSRGELAENHLTPNQAFNP